MGKRAVAAVAGEMWEPAFGAGFQAPRANQESQVSYSSRPPAARHFHSKAANSAHFLRNRIFGLPDGLKSSFSRKPPKMHPSSDSCAVPKKQAAKMYHGTYEGLLTRLCNGRLLHAGETKIGIRGNDGFVWVFANMEEVAYFYTETREGDWLQTMLKDFKGVLVSDFYAAYDAIPCPQQKCLIHLIRDLNDDVLKHPYDEELKQLAQAFTVLLKPMVETIDRFGLKSRFLKKYLPSVKRFYRQVSESNLQSETAAKLKERLEKNQDKLFTFLKYDGVPWNNNNAEHVVKPFAALRSIIGGVTTEKGLRDYLVLLSICQSCKYSGLDFLDFLLS